MVKEKDSPESPMKSPLSIVTVTHKRAQQKQSRVQNYVEANADTIKRAEKFRVNLGSEFPTFVKSLTQSHVSGGCMKLALPAQFCRLHLVGDECIVTLVDECGREYKVTYNGKRWELTWSRFATSNELSVGDVAVFELVGHFKFKVYIIREKDLPSRDDTNHLALVASLKQNDSASDSSVGTSQSENDNEYSDNSDTEHPDHSDTEDSWAMVIAGYPKNLERNKRKRSELLPESDAKKCAKKIQADLAAEFPSCIKVYSQSFHDREYLRLPQTFCSNNLKDYGLVKDVILVSEDNGKEYTMKFFQEWNELNCGWTSFSKGNDLHVGDVLVLCLIGPFKFKVYIVREKELVGADRALYAVSETDHGASPTDQNASEDAAVSSGPASDVFNVKSFEDFTIVVNGMTLDSNISEEVKRKYYGLCSSQKSNLHQHLTEHVDTIGWIDAIISKTVAISDDIRTCSFSTPRSFYESRITLLESFEKLGMNVRFLCDRLKYLMSIAFESKALEVLRRQADAQQELSDLEEIITSLEIEILKLQKKKQELAHEIEEKKSIAEDHECKFLETAKAAW